MAQPQRSDVDPRGLPLPRGEDGRHYEAGGPIAQLQADLAQRLTGAGVEQGPVFGSPLGERAVRFASVTGGYLALAAGYAVAAFAIVRLI